ncbi:MAG: hypothetical protein JWQ50_8988 [Caballeronia mineralivorans]|jgi:hypothetical protein|nr:hypothetical protein [Caballeronia mineralivorans]MEA3104538.1 hypothetical protein [Caballeronia mineralivorans]
MEQATFRCIISIAVEIISLPKIQLWYPCVERCLCRSLSRVDRETHARFWGLDGVTAPSYPTEVQRLPENDRRYRL